MGRLSSEVLSSIIGDIYDCVLDPDGWTGVMIRITVAIDAAYSTIALASTTDSYGRFAAQSPWDPEQMRLLEGYSFDAIPGLTGAVMGDVDTPVATLSQMSEGELRSTPFYQNWAGPQGLREACVTKFVHTTDRIGLLSCTTRVDRGAVTSREQQFLALLSPHLRRASLIGDMLDQAQVTAHPYREVLDNLAVSIVLTDPDGAIYYANPMAERMFSEQGPIQSLNGLLNGRNPSTACALRNAIARAAGGDASLGTRGIGLPISSAGDPPAVAYVLPLTSGTARAALRPASAAVFVSTTTSATPLPEAVLATLFDLTPAEARVLLQIGRGLAPAQVADLLDISENTLKTHLSRIFVKTNTRRQVDLVRLASEIATPLMPPTL